METPIEQLNWEDFNRTLINRIEKRVADYKILLEQIGRNRDLYPPQDENVQWLRALVREQKNQEESNLASLREEQRWTRQGLNPPFCYPEKYRQLN
jgi:hypothetical protein